jgi:hypothetical protein
MCDGVAAFGAERKLMFKVRSFRFCPQAAVPGPLGTNGQDPEDNQETPGGRKQSQGCVRVAEPRFPRARRIAYKKRPDRILQLRRSATPFNGLAVLHGRLLSQLGIKSSLRGAAAALKYQRPLRGGF